MKPSFPCCFAAILALASGACERHPHEHLLTIERHGEGHGEGHGGQGEGHAGHGTPHHGTGHGAEAGHTPADAHPAPGGSAPKFFPESGKPHP